MPNREHVASLVVAYLRKNTDLAAGYSLPGLTPGMITEGLNAAGHDVTVARVRYWARYMADLGHIDMRQHPRDHRSWVYAIGNSPARGWHK